ncbi:TrbC/VirB2 family protein [Desulfovibrio sp. 1188_IL3213]|uniref:TrbC/VirB2 family protein n=2 Tax=unclassified Desulfovibrio TaxID=2593640 RepID=UPI002FDB783C
MTASIMEIVMNAKTLPPNAKSLLKPLAVLGLMALCLCFPDIAAASGGITEFSSPLERVVNTITGPAGKWISIVAMALCGVIFIMNKDDISGGFKLLLSVVFGISFIAFAASIVNSVFSFSGAVI